MVPSFPFSLLAPPLPSLLKKKEKGKTAQKHKKKNSAFLRLLAVVLPFSSKIELNTVNKKKLSRIRRSESEVFFFSNFFGFNSDFSFFLQFVFLFVFRFIIFSLGCWLLGRSLEGMKI